jgi:hypothetical protein
MFGFCRINIFFPEVNQQNAALNLAITCFLAESNILPLVAELAAFREMISASQHNSCTNVVKRHEFGKGGVYLEATQAQI